MNFSGTSPLSQDDARDTTSFMISFKLHKHPSAPEPWAVAGKGCKNDKAGNLKVRTVAHQRQRA